MASAVGKTSQKPQPTTKKESTPTKQEQNGGEKKSETKQDDSRSDQKRDNRFQNNRGDNRFQNRRGGGNQNFNNRGRGRGGFFGNRDNRDNSQGNYGGGFTDCPFQIEEEEGPKEQKKFTGRCRLFVGNITPDTTEEQFKELFTPFGEVSEVFVNAARGFGFIRMDYRINAERAKLELDGTMRNNRVLRVRFATHGAALKVYNLSPFVSNELLEQAFSQFGELERAVVIVDVRGRSCGEAIVEFARKPGANAAMKRINEGIFLLSSSQRPIRVEPVDQRDEEDGLTEKLVQKNDGFRKDREKEPRFAPPGSFEFEFGMKYRRIDEREKEAMDRVKADFETERQRLIEEMETAVFDYQAEQIRQDLIRKQEELKRLDALKNEHMRRTQELDMRRQEQVNRSQPPQDMRSMEMRQEEERRREMMMRASNTINREGGIGSGISPRQGRPEDMMMRGGPNNMRHESPQRGGRDNQRGSGPGTPPMPPPPVPPGMNMDQDNRFMSGNMGGGSSPSSVSDLPIMERPDAPPMKQESPMQRPGPPNQQSGRFPGPPGPGNFPPGMGNMSGPGVPGGMFPNRPGMGGPMGPGGNDRRREGGRRDDYDSSKRMRRY